MKFQLPLLTVTLVAICLSPQLADAQQEQQSTTVFAPNEEAMSAKRQLLGKIDPVSGNAKRPPNVLLIVADDLGYADTSVYGSQTIPTPHIDALAQGGVRFTDAYVTAATCSPSRAGLMSGRYQASDCECF